MKKIVLLLFILILMALAACSSGVSTETAPEPMEVTLIATDIAFDEQRLEAAAGQKVRLTLDNQGVLEHDFTIVEMPLSGEVTVIEEPGEMEDHDMGHVEDEPDVHVAAPSGDGGTIEFVPSAPGEYTFYCTVSGHREAGMEGVLIVE